MKQENFQLNTSTLAKRGIQNRRNQYFNSFLHSLNKGSRVCVRRQTEVTQGYYIDSYEKQLGMTVVSVIMLCALDAFFTLNILSRGGGEANPFMSVLLAYDASVFMITKMAITIISLLFVLVHINFRIFNLFSMKTLLQSILTGYILLIGYELLLLVMI